MEQNEQTPADLPQDGQSPFGPPVDESSPESPPPITLLGDDQRPIQPYVGQTAAEAVIALVLSLSGVFMCCGCSAVSLALGISALMLAVAAKKKIRADPYLDGDGLANAAITIALIILTLHALGSTTSFLIIGSAPWF